MSTYRLRRVALVSTAVLLAIPLTATVAMAQQQGYGAWQAQAPMPPTRSVYDPYPYSSYSSAARNNQAAINWQSQINAYSHR